MTRTRILALERPPDPTDAAKVLWPRELDIGRRAGRAASRTATTPRAGLDSPRVAAPSPSPTGETNFLQSVIAALTSD